MTDSRNVEHMIAAAPDMLAALKHVEAFLVVDARTKGALTIAIEELKVIRAAIAKAEGRA